MTDGYASDIIRPLGLVTLYAGYAELEIDTLLESLSALHDFKDQKRKWPVGQKLAQARRIVSALNSDRRNRLISVVR
jgi:hypothetical protein